jgi:hypothetical protein
VPFTSLTATAMWSTVSNVFNPLVSDIHTSRFHRLGARSGFNYFSNRQRTK